MALVLLAPILARYDIDPRLLCVAIAVIALTLWLRKRKLPEGKRLPPGPKGLPIIGHLLHRTQVFDHKRCMELAKVYGPVIRFPMGVKDVVILNDYESVKEILSRKEMLFRSESNVVSQTEYQGIGTLNGDDWKQNRNFCLHVLRDLGFGKKSMEDHILEEAACLLEKVAETKEAPFDLEKYLAPSVSNNITALVFGRRFPFEDQKRKFLDDRSRRLAKLFQSGSRFTFLPCWVFKITNLLPNATSHLVKEILDELAGFISEEIEQHEETLDERSNRDFIDGYLKKMKEHENDPDAKFKKLNLTGNVLAFMGGGTHTIKSTVHWHMLNCADKPDTVQRKIQEEIDKVVGKERSPRWDDQGQMPFTMATIMEMYRWRAIALLAIPREAAADSVYKDYVIPKGSVVIPNIGAVHMDPAHWENPEEFMPERFLKEDGTGLKPKPEQLIPFSVGKRMCPGETLATVEIFLYLTTILQKFTVLPPDGRRIVLQSASAAVNYPQLQELRFISR
ncbi:cytochrome P450 2H2-like isoform X1 [Haemaphysalis longicornis]